MTVQDSTRLNLIRMSHQKCSLFWEVVINVGNNLHSHIGLSCAWRPNDLRENEDKKLKQREK